MRKSWYWRMLGAELIGTSPEVLGKLGDGVQVNADGRGRVLADLQILPHPLT
jgi:hypothetical protein